MTSLRQIHLISAQFSLVEIWRRLPVMAQNLLFGTCYLILCSEPLGTGKSKFINSVTTEEQVHNFDLTRAGLFQFWLLLQSSIPITSQNWGHIGSEKTNILYVNLIPTLSFHYEQPRNQPPSTNTAIDLVDFWLAGGKTIYWKWFSYPRDRFAITLGSSITIG